MLYAVGMRAENTLYEQLREVMEEVYAVGDCVRPRQVNQAVHEAYFTAMDIGLYA